MEDNLTFERTGSENHFQSRLVSEQVGRLRAEALPSAGQSLSQTLPGIDFASAKPAGSVQSPVESSARKTLLGHFIGRFTDMFRNTSANHRLAAMQSETQLRLAAGAPVSDVFLQEQNRLLQAAQDNDERIVRTGTNFTKALALFLPEKLGRFASAAVYGADAVHLQDSLALQFTDAAIGAGKGYLLKSGFDYLGAKQMALAPKAMLLGFGARTAEYALDRHTYINPTTGTVDISAGLSRAGKAMLSPEAMTSDLLIFGTAYLAMKGLPGAAAQYLKHNPAAAASLTGGLFGLSGGAIAEINHQHKTGTFDLSAIIHSSLTQGAADGIAGYIGGRTAGLIRADATAVRRPDSTAGVESQRPVITLQRELLPAQPRSPDHHLVQPRTFVMQGEHPRVLDFLAGKNNTPLLLPVREVSGSRLGPQQVLLMQHAERPGQIDTALAARADLHAICDPQLLPAAARANHLFPHAAGPVFAAKRSGDSLLTFSLRTPALEPGLRVRALGTTPSELLLDPRLPQRFRDIHDLQAMARVLSHIKEPGVKVMGGAESMVIQLGKDSNFPGQMLRITDKPWDPAWGTRTVQADSGLYVFDAKMLTKPTHVTVDGEAFTYFVQEATRSPVSPKQAKQFADLIAQRTFFEFWDAGKYGLHTQMGYASRPQGDRLVIFDYGSVRPKPRERALAW